MDPSEINSFEDQWRRALKEASETPPPSVWQGIEARLEADNEKGVLLPLWWRSPKIWYAAASIAALLLVGAGIWYSGKNAENDKVNSTIAASKSAESPADKGAQLATPDENVPIKEKELVAKGVEASKPQPEVSDKKTTLTLSGKTANDETNSLETANRTELRGKAYAARFDKNNEPGTANKNLSIAARSKNPVDKAADELGVISSEKEKSEHLAVELSAQPSITAELLSSLPYSELNVHMQKRYVFFRPAVESEEPDKFPSHKEYWAGIGLMPASFNPDLKVKEAPLGFSNQTVANKKSVSGTSEAGVSYALQTQGGMRLSKHWSLEMGVSYLKGNSNYQGGGYLLSANNSSSGNVLENALAGIAPASSSLSADKNYNFANSGSIYVDVSKKVSNNYQYLQLPVQAGFTLNPDKKLSYSVLGGMMANFFLSNDLEAASGEIIKTTANDEIYRSMNWAATTGLRFNYKLTSRWKASLTGSYQKAITSGFRSNQSLDVHPYLYGVAWGVRYSF